MRAPRVVARKGMSDVPAPADTASVEALLSQAVQAIEGLTAELRTAHQAISPAAEAITELGTAQKKLCAFLVKHRLKILMLIGAVSPGAAEGIRAALRLWGAQ